MVKWSRTRLFTTVFAALALLGAACGGGSGGEDASTTTSTLPDEVITEETPPETSSTTTTTTTTEAPGPTVEPIPVIDVADIPALVVAWGESDGDPLELAKAIIGFPIEIAVPDNSSALNVRVEMRGRELDTPWAWDWSYEATAGDGVGIGDIVITLDDNGPGSVALSDLYDPILAALGWSRTGTTGSDPSSGGGGPQSVNHVYQSDTDMFMLGEIDATTDPLFVWALEDVDFRDGPDVPGYRMSIGLDAQPNFIPVPLLEALFRQVPIAPGARLTEVTLRSLDRPEGSIDEAEGLRYLQIEYICELLPDSSNQAIDVYTNGLAGTVYQLGEESFFDEGFIEITDPQVGDHSWVQSIIVLDRYPGEIIVTVEPETNAVTSIVRMTLEPGREVLLPLAG